MKNIEILSKEPLDKPLYVKPYKVIYKQNNKEKFWEVVKSHDSVAILLYHIERESFLVVKQFRPPVYLNNKNIDGFTYELCAGIIDKDKLQIQIAKEEIFEECGFDVELSEIQRVSSFYSNVGVSGSHQTLYFAKICDKCQINDGGGTENEFIEPIYIPLSEAKQFIFDESKPKTPGLMFSFLWFFENHIVL